MLQQEIDSVQRKKEKKTKVLYLYVFNYRYSETSLIWPPFGPTVGGLINKMALLLKTSLMRPFNKLALLSRVSNSY